MNSINLAEIYNSATFWGLVVGLLISVWVLILKINLKSKTSKR